MQRAPLSVGGGQPAVAQHRSPVRGTKRQLAPTAVEHRPEIARQGERELQRSPNRTVRRPLKRESLLEAERSVHIPLAHCSPLVANAVRGRVRQRTGDPVEPGTVANSRKRHREPRAAGADEHARACERDPRALRRVKSVETTTPMYEVCGIVRAQRRRHRSLRAERQAREDLVHGASESPRLVAGRWWTRRTAPPAAKGMTMSNTAMTERLSAFAPRVQLTETTP